MLNKNIGGIDQDREKSFQRLIMAKKIRLCMAKRDQTDISTQSGHPSSIDGQPSQELRT